MFEQYQAVIINHCVNRWDEVDETLTKNEIIYRTEVTFGDI